MAVQFPIYLTFKQFVDKMPAEAPERNRSAKNTGVARGARLAPVPSTVRLPYNRIYYYRALDETFAQAMARSPMHGVRCDEPTLST